METGRTAADRENVEVGRLVVTVLLLPELKTNMDSAHAVFISTSLCDRLVRNRFVPAIVTITRFCGGVIYV
jgi:hypothetical protein